MAAPADLIKLVERFRENRETYLSDAFNETALRLQFIDPHVRDAGLGHRQPSRRCRGVQGGGPRGLAEHRRFHQGAWTIRSGSEGCGSSSLRPRSRPSKSSRTSVPAFQLRRYAWSARLPLSILTNFAEFAVYDCRVRPEKSDSPSTARTLYVTFDQYEDRWDEIAAVFSREAVLKGSFDRYAESTKRKRGTAEVEAAFLDEIETWRSELARNLALRNPGLSQRD